jgi:hypothetical protein
MWSLLLLTLPTQPNAVRVRVWRALKSLGCAALRDGAYLLPADRGVLFDPLAAEVRQHGGTAMVLGLSATDAAQAQALQALFDRSEGYAQWRATALALQAALASLGETEARRRLRGVADALLALRGIDFFPAAAADQAEAELASLRQALDALFSHGEPRPRAGHAIERLDIASLRGKRWASQARPWVDRLACTWLVWRFVDPDAQVLWLDQPDQAPADTLGFDFDGARFAHVGALVSFEVMLASFGLAADPKLQRIAAAVHWLDVGGIPVPEAAGLESVLAGLRVMHADDHRLAAAAAAVFDALHAAPAATASSAAAR